MLSRLVIALVVGVVVFLACILLGALLANIDIDFVVTIANFLKNYASLIALLAALWQFFSGGFSMPTRKV